MLPGSLDVSRSSGTDDGSLAIADSQLEECRQPPMASGASVHSYPENVAGLWLKCGASRVRVSEFFAPQNNSARSDDLLTLPVDNVDRAGL
jgi:hypothetical protein